MRTVGLQWGVVMVLAGGAWAIAGGESGGSCLAGGAAVAAPNTLLATYLWLKARQVGLLSAATFLLGEFLKLGLTIVCLYLVARLLPSVHWLALVVGVIGALKAQWLALWFTRNA